jgi:transposase
VRYSNETKLQVQTAIACGVTVAECSRVFGASKGTINSWLNANRHKSQKDACRNWYHSDPEKAKAYHRQWYQDNIEKSRKVGREHMKRKRKENPERFHQLDKEYHKRKYAKYPHRFKERTAKYRHKKREVTFPMCKIERMMCQNYYLLARELTKETGIPHEVDHIWPISRGGPHLPWNLQVLTKEENRKKGNTI